MIAQNTIQQVIDRAEITDIVGQFVKLKRRGANYLGNCPFHNEKTPSFTVSPAKGIYKCFGCGKAGNSVTFLQEHEKLSFTEAIRWLAAHYKIEIEEKEVSPEVKAQMQVEESLRIVNTFASKFFAEQLLESEEGRAIGLSYFKERGFREEIIQKFQLGYCPQGPDALAREAQQQGYNTELLQKAGLVSQYNGRYQDIYRGRVIFPIHAATGKVLGFGARSLRSSDKAKYINTPDNDLYHKRFVLYGIYQARQAITQQDECFMVEGYADVVSLHQGGVENVVASSGTSLTIEQLRLVKRYTKNLTILYDGDAAGIKAAERGLDLAIEEGLNVKLALLPDGEDPDSYILKYGSQQLKDFVRDNKQDFILFKVGISLKNIGNDSQAKAKLVNDIAVTLSRINKTEDFTKQQDYIRRCAQLLKIDEQGLIQLVNKNIREYINKQQEKNLPPKDTNEMDALAAEAAAYEAQIGGGPSASPDVMDLVSKEEKQEKGLVKALIEFGQLPFDEDHSVAQHIRNTIELEFIETTLLHGIVSEYFEMMDQGTPPELKHFTFHKSYEVSQLMANLFNFPYDVSANWKQFGITPIPREMVYKQDVESALAYFQLKKIKKMIEENFQAIQTITDEQDLILHMKAHLELKKMEKELVGKVGTVVVK
jgi:DNA primase